MPFVAHLTFYLWVCKMHKSRRTASLRSLIGSDAVAGGLLLYGLNYWILFFVWKHPIESMRWRDRFVRRRCLAANLTAVSVIHLLVVTDHDHVDTGWAPHRRYKRVVWPGYWIHPYHVITSRIAFHLPSVDIPTELQPSKPFMNSAAAPASFAASALVFAGSLGFLSLRIGSSRNNWTTAGAMPAAF